jgi:DNA repair photolyase
MEAGMLRGELLSVANSSDPYPQVESELMVMRSCLRVLSKCNCGVQVVTKSPLVTRDVDLLTKVPSMVSMTVTTDDDELAGLLEPGAPVSSARLRAVETLVGRSVPVSVRVDPIIPFVNDAAEGLMEKLAGLGVRHVTCSTFKVRSDGWRRFSLAMPDVAAKLWPLYFELGEFRAGYRLMPENLRLELMERVGRLARRHGMKFGTCREDFSRLNTAACDGSWLLKEKLSQADPCF